MSAVLLPVSPPLPSPSTSVDTSLTNALVNQQSEEIRRLSGELTSRNGMCEVLRSELISLTADFEKARFKISELDSVMEVLRSELVTSRSQLESAKIRFSNELAEINAVILAARNARDAAVGHADSVNKYMLLTIDIVDFGITTAPQRKYRLACKLGEYDQSRSYCYGGTRQCIDTC
jgi:hypothetical protein